MKICSIPGCTNPVKARGWCCRHYQRWEATGDPVLTPTAVRHGHADDILWLLSCGVAVEEAIARVGWTPAAAYRWALRNNRPDLCDAVRPAYSRSHRKTAAA